MNTSKQKAIEKAYGELISSKDLELIKDFIQEDGYCVMIDYRSGKEVINHKTLNEMGFSKDDGLLDTGYFSEEKRHKWRPKSLQGIENNNGWISINSVEDLPEEEGTFEVHFKTNYGVGHRTEIFTGKLCNSIHHITGDPIFSHYKKYTKSENPLY